MGGRKDCCGYGTSFHSKYWLSWDACGMFCISCSFGVHIYATLVNSAFLISRHFFAQAYFVIIYLPIMILAVWSLVMAWRTNPGAVPMGSRPLTTVKPAGSTTPDSSENGGGAAAKDKTKQSRQRGTRRCAKCNDNFKPARAHHDSVTGRCIVKMDHYCPWVCNAVGAMNHKFFCLFILYTLLTCLNTIFLVALRFVRCGGTLPGSNDDDSEDDWNDPNSKRMDPSRFLGNTTTTTTTTTESFSFPECHGLYTNVWIVLLLIVAVLFLIFTCCMLIDQIEAVQSNTSKIARMKMKIGQGGTELERVSYDFNEMFGGTSPQMAWHWFVPLPLKFPDGMEKVVLGYDWDPTYDAAPFQENDMVAALELRGGEKKQQQQQEKEQQGLDLEQGGGGAVMDDSLTSFQKDPITTSSSTTTMLSKRGGHRKDDNTPTFVDKTRNRLT